MDNDALVTWVGDDLPSPLGRIRDRFAPGFEPEILIEQGWWPLLVRLDASLVTLVPDYAIRYVRPQSGQLQFILDPFSVRNALPVFEDAIRDAEAESQRTCEVCGRHGHVTVRKNGVHTVLCEEDAGFLRPDPKCASTGRLLT